MLFRRNHDLPAPPPGPTPEDIAEAQEAREESQREFLEAVDQNLEVRQLMKRLRDRRTMDNFDRLLRRSMGMGDR